MTLMIWLNELTWWTTAYSAYWQQRRQARRRDCYKRLIDTIYRYIRTISITWDQYRRRPRGTLTYWSWSMRLRNSIGSTHGDAHLHGKKMEQQLRQDYHIPDLSKRIERLTLNCVPCVLANKKRGKLDGWLNPIDKGNVPLAYDLDHVGPMESTLKLFMLAIYLFFGKANVLHGEMLNVVYFECLSSAFYAIVYIKHLVMNENACMQICILR